MAAYFRNTMTIAIIPSLTGYQIVTPFNRAFVDDLKSHLPATGRFWNSATRRWEIADKYLDTARMLIERHYGQDPGAPQRLPGLEPTAETRTIEIHYIGAARQRGDGDALAFGYDAGRGNWSVMFPEEILKAYFNSTEATGEKLTFYEVLGVSQDAEVDEIKTAHRRAARSWHPDVCKEENAAEMFIRIQSAWEALREETTRRKYNAGLFLERSLRMPRISFSNLYGYVTPVRCGLVTCEGIERLGRFSVSKIIAWDDIRNDTGLVMVSSWPKGGEIFQIEWVAF